MAGWDREREEQVQVFTSRECRRCGRLYVWPRGSRRPGAMCPECQPALPLELTGEQLPMPEPAS